eukprot:scaffold565_cov358-Prasinococcus_capsulatus_cf.AAC.3
MRARVLRRTDDGRAPSSSSCEGSMESIRGTGMSARGVIFGTSGPPASIVPGVTSFDAASVRARFRGVVSLIALLSPIEATLVPRPRPALVPRARPLGRPRGRPRPRLDCCVGEGLTGVTVVAGCADGISAPLPAENVVVGMSQSR